MLADAAREPALFESGLAALEQCDWHAHARWCAAASRIAADPAARIDQPALVHHALAGGIPAPACAQLLDAHLRSMQTHAAPYPGTSRLARKPLRVGYLIDRGDAVWPGALLQDLLAHHDRARIEPVVYCVGNLDTRWAQANRAGNALLRPVAHLKPHETQGLIRVDDIDVLVDMCGLAHPLAAPILLTRPARAHVHLAVHASAAARPVIATVRLPGLPDDEAPLARKHADSGLPGSGTLLCSLAPPWAIGPDTFAAWMEALSTAAESHLMLFNVEPAVQTRLRDAAAAWHIAPARLHFVVARSLLDQLAIARLADIHVEALHATDGREAAVARACCAPLVAPGNTERATRPGASALREVGLGEYAATDRASYISRIGEMLASSSMLAQTRQRFAGAWKDAPDGGFPGWVRALEQGIESIYAERVSLASANGR